MSLTQEELQLITESWTKIYSNPEESGVILLKGFLDTFNYYDKFPKFAGVPRDELPKNATFRNHGVSVVKELNALVLGASEEEKWVKHINDLVKRHKVRNIYYKEFENLMKALLGSFKDDFKVKDDAINAWKKVFDSLLKHVAQAMDN